MSEDGWRSFLTGDGFDDWVILHGGPTAVFNVGSLHEAARLAAAVVEFPGLGPRTLQRRLFSGELVFEEGDARLRVDAVSRESELLA